MAWLYASGHAVDLVLMVIGLEFVWLWRSGWRPLSAFLCLAPGALMLLALRAALVGSGWPVIGLLLIASFPVHLADLGLRKKERPGG